MQFLAESSIITSSKSQIRSQSVPRNSKIMYCGIRLNMPLLFNNKSSTSSWKYRQLILTLTLQLKYISPLDINIVWNMGKILLKNNFFHKYYTRPTILAKFWQSPSSAFLIDWTYIPHMTVRALTLIAKLLILSNQYIHTASSWKPLNHVHNKNTK